MKNVLRRHGKIIMAILGVILMIVFSLPAFNSQRDTSNDAVGTLNGSNITNRDVLFAAQELTILKEAARMLNYRDLDPSPLLDERDPRIHWILLCKDAERYGFENVGLSWDGVKEMLGEQTADALLRGLQNQNQQSIAQAFTHWKMVMSLLNFAFDVPQPVSEVELLADQELTKVRVAYATLDAVKDNTANAPAPSESEIQKQFNTYKGVVHTRIPTSANAPVPPLPPVINGHRYPFGYKYPDRVKVEFLKFDRAKLRDMIQVTQEDYDAAFAYYKEHPNEFRAGAPGSTTQPVKAWDDVKKELVERQLNERVKKLINKMVDRVKSQAAEPWKAAEVDEKGFKKTLPQDKWASYEKLAQEISKNRDFYGYTPEYKAYTGQWLDAEGLENLPEIGGATFIGSDKTTELTFPALATHVRELAELSARDPLGRLFLQAGVEGPVLQDKEQNLYLYRVVEAAPAAEPKSLDEVKPQVVADLKLLGSYEHERQAAQELAKSANKGDLAAQAAERKLPVEKTPEFSKLDTELPETIQRINGFVDAAHSLVPGNAASATAPATQPTGIGATTTLDNDNTLKVYVLQLLDISPAKPMDFALRRLELLSRPDPGMRNFTTRWFSLENVMERLKYVPKQALQAKKTEEG